VVYLKIAGQYLAVLFCILALNFALPRIAPGNPASYLVGSLNLQIMSEEEINRVLREFKLDLPLPVQFKNYLGGIFRGDMGISTVYGRPVWDILRARLPWTLLLMGLSLLVSSVLGVVIGVLGAWKRGGGRDIWPLLLVMVLGSVPPFWVAMLFITLFSAVLGWLPSFGAYSIGAVPGTGAYTASVIKHLVMPVMTLSIIKTGSMYLTTRSSMIIALEEDYILLAHAKGLREKAVVFVHALRNAILPVYTHLMTGLGALVGGSAVVETVFSYPGLGNTIYESVRARDYNLLQGSFLVISVSILIANLLADLGYPLLDPRVRRQGVPA
jgi:peptide/nickel transport system permease protein